MLLEVLTGELTFKSRPPPDLTKCTKQELLTYFENSYDLNESLFTALNDESVFYTCPDRLRLPLIFYYCHTAVVYVNKLMLAGLMKERINFEFEKLFETGVDEMSWDDTENYRMGGAFEWPPLADVVEYRRNVRNVVINLIRDTPLQLPITMESKWWGLLMGMEHERIHLETSSVLIRQLPVDMVTKPEGWLYGPVKAADSEGLENTMIRVDGRDVTFGKPEDFPSYGWDNEYGEVKRFVPTFEASKNLITNKEFYQFIQDGGYNKQEFWTEEGWKWKTFRQSKHPMFWICNNGCRSGCGADLASYSHCSFSANQENGNINGVSNGNGYIVANGYENHDLYENGNAMNGFTNDNNNSGTNESSQQYKYRAMFDILEMPWTWPVEINYHEAKAYCAWKGKDYRLLTEAEHNAIRGYQASPSTGTSSDPIFSTDSQYNYNMKFGSSTPVNLFPSNKLGFHDVFGNVWQWQEDHFNGLTTHTHWLYDDFSGPCYDGRHNMILGGSWISTGDEASRFARFAFRRHFLQHAGFRIARSVTDSDESVPLPVRLVNTEVYVLGSGIEENKVYLDQKIQPEFHPSANVQYKFESQSALYGIMEMEFGFRKSFPVVVAELCQNLTKSYDIQPKSSLWIGAGTGRGPFTLSRTYRQILAMDYCARFLETAMKIQNGTNVTFPAGDGSMTASLLPTDKPENIKFKQFTWIANEVPIDNDLTVVTFLERTNEPKAWLLRLGEVTKQSGLVVVASHDGSWGKEQLEPTLTEKRLKCVDIQNLPYESQDGEKLSTVTVWKHM